MFVVGDLALHLLQLGAWLEVSRNALAGYGPGQVVLRSVPGMGRIAASAVGPATPAAYGRQAAGAKVADMGEICVEASSLLLKFGKVWLGRQVQQPPLSLISHSVYQVAKLSVKPHPPLRRTPMPKRPLVLRCAVC